MWTGRSAHIRAAWLVQCVAGCDEEVVHWFSVARGVTEPLESVVVFGYVSLTGAPSPARALSVGAHSACAQSARTLSSSCVG